MMRAPPKQRNAARGMGGASEGLGRASVASAKRRPDNTRLDLSLQRQAEALHERGPRPLGELLAEVMDRMSADDAEWLRARLERYNRIPPEVYARVGARRFPAPPVREVAG